MKERIFIERNKSKWLRFEQLFKDKKNDNPEELSTLFVQITDDLSYARTYYPNRSVRVYLNRLASAVFLSIYTKKSTKWERLKSFWASELPKIVYESRADLFLSTFIFLISVAIGVFCTHLDPEFTRSILGDNYVNMTLENIKNNDPMAVYKGENEVTMFLSITLNNIKVAFNTFLLGIIFMVGTIGILLYNGIMLGTFQYFFVQNNLFVDSALTIWLHGTIEILSIIIAGGAGMVMGRGLIFPGTLTRWQSFQLSAKRGVKIMIGIVPLFIIAGFIEGFITRHTEVPPMVRLFFILLCLAFMLFYFVYLPYKKRFYNEVKTGLERFEEDTPLVLDRFTTLKNTEVISNSFKIIMPNLWKWFLIIGSLNIIIALLMTLLIPQDPELAEKTHLFLEPFTYFGNIMWGDVAGITVRIVDIIGLTLVILITSRDIQKAYGIETSIFSQLVSPLFLRLLLFFSATFWLYALEDNTIVFLGTLLLPLLYLLTVPQHYEEGKGKLKGMYNRLGSTLLNHYLMSLFAFFMGAMLLWLTGALLYPVISRFLFPLFYLSEVEYSSLQIFFSALMSNFVVFYAFVFMNVLSILSYISEKEKHEGRGLKERIKVLFP